MVHCINLGSCFKTIHSILCQPSHITFTRYFFLLLFLPFFIVILLSSPLCAMPVVVDDLCSPAIPVPRTTHHFPRCIFVKPGDETPFAYLYFLPVDVFSCYQVFQPLPSHDMAEERCLFMQMLFVRFLFSPALCMTSSLVTLQCMIFLVVFL